MLRACSFLLLVAVVGCGKRTDQTPIPDSPAKPDPQMQPAPVSRTPAPDVPTKSLASLRADQAVLTSDDKTAPLPRPSMTTDFEELARWCKKASDDIAKENSANPIRGEELQAKKMRELRAKMDGKVVRWKLKVTKIAPPNSIHLSSFYAEDLAPPRGIMRRVLDVKFNLQGYLEYGNPGLNRLDNVSDADMRHLSVGDHVTVTGKVAEVFKLPFQTDYVLRVNEASIEQP